MKLFPLVTAVLLLASLAFAGNYSGTGSYAKEYLVDGWLKVTRTIVVKETSACSLAAATGACGATGAVAPLDLGTREGYSTTVNLSLENAGTLARREAALTESLAHVPEGAKMEFFPKPSSLEGRAATWPLGDLEPGDTRELSYSFNARLDEGDVANLQEAQASSAPINAVLSAPAHATVGQTVVLSLRTGAGIPVAGATIKVIGPDGSLSYLTTSSRGNAQFTPKAEGAYSYSVSGYSTARLSRTLAQAEEEPVVAASAVAEGGLGNSIMGLLPLLGGIFAAAVVAMIAYNFLSSRKEEQPSPPQQPASSQTAEGSSGAVYSQSYSFGASKPQAAPSQLDEATRQLVESRRMQLSGREGKDAVPLEVQESRKKQLPDYSPQPPRGQAEPADWTESASSDEEVEAQMTHLERRARNEGESASQEEEIENAIAELEAIRQKLKERKEQMDSLSQQEAQPEEEQEAPEEKLPQRTPLPKKKLKLGTHGVKRK